MELTSVVVAFGALVLHFGLQVVFVVRALLRPHREPSSRIAWVLVILAVPAIGMLAYLLFGETSIGQRRIARYKAASDRVAAFERAHPGSGQLNLASRQHRHLFKLGETVNGFRPVSGNGATVFAASDATIDALVADMDAARHHIHLLFYIWLADSNGLKVVEAAKRAAGRGVIVRAMADDIGSRGLIRSQHWEAMEAAGVRVCRALPIGNPLLHPIRGRVDLRNHRKIMVIDNRVTYCGSQNCADAEFRVKPKFAPWVDMMVRFEGPIAMQNQALFVQDWMSHVDDDLRDLLSARPGDSAEGGVVAQVVGTGPTVRSSAMPEMFEVLLHAARQELVVTTPYYVPSESMHSALCAAGRKGVATTIVFPARNDSWIVAAASRSYYDELIDAGVRIFEYPHGLLHAKTLTLDGEVTLVGSANLDRRSFDLNYENNILLESRDLTREIRAQQQAWIDVSAEIGPETVAGWSRRKRLWFNTVAMLGPVL